MIINWYIGLYDITITCTVVVRIAQISITIHTQISTYVIYNYYVSVAISQVYLFSESVIAKMRD